MGVKPTDESKVEEIFAATILLVKENGLAGTRFASMIQTVHKVGLFNKHTSNFITDSSLDNILVKMGEELQIP